VQPAPSQAQRPPVHFCEGAQAMHVPPAVPQAAAVGGFTHWPF
jgi:hypothetical protein